MNKTKIERWILDLEQSIDQPVYAGIEEYTRCRDLCMMLFLKLKEEIKETGIDSLEDEIFFFKKLKPRLVSKYFYFIKLMNIESKIPIGSTELKTKYFEEEKSKLDNYYLRHMDFCQYIKSKKTHLDHLYFTRGNHHIIHYGEYQYIEMDQDFSTSHGFILARLTANENLLEYLARKIREMEGLSSTNLDYSGQLSWHSTKTDLVELIYALHESGSVRGEISATTSVFQDLFNIELGEIYKTWSAIRMRKKEKTVFLSKMQERLINKIEYYDE